MKPHSGVTPASGATRFLELMTKKILINSVILFDENTIVFALSGQVKLPMGDFGEFKISSDSLRREFRG